MTNRFRPLTPIFDIEKEEGSIDIGGTPGTPIFHVIGSVQSAAYLEGARHLAAFGNYVVVGARDVDAVTLVDASDPSMPTVTGSIINSSSIGAVDGIVIHGSRAFVTRGTGDRLTAVSLATPATPSVVSSLADGTNLDGAAGLAVKDSIALVCAFNIDKVSAIDISNPASMSYSGGVTHAAMGGAIDCTVIDDYLLVAARNDDSIVVLDISTPSTPVYETDYLDGSLLGLVETLHPHSGNLWAWAPGYISSWEIGGLFVIDNLGELADSDLTVCFGLGTLESYLAVPSYASGQVKLLDTSDPEDPVVAYELTMPNGWLPWACTEVNGVLAVTCDGNGDNDPVVFCGFG